MIRMPAVAGLFYPDAKVKLRHLLKTLLDTASALPQPGKALITPHAGLIYSGAFAAQAYAAVRDRIFDRIVILGPSHRVPFVGLALSSADQFFTPLGAININQDAQAVLLDLPYVNVFDDAHAFEHSLEVQLPFIQMLWPDATLVPILIGDAGPEQIATVIEHLRDRRHTLLVISSDLSHFHDAETAHAIDLETCALIEQHAYLKLNGKRACGYQAIAGLLIYAEKHGLQVNKVALGHSGEITGDNSRVVGYGAFVAV